MNMYIGVVVAKTLSNTNIVYFGNANISKNLWLINRLWLS